MSEEQNGHEEESQGKNKQRYPRRLLRQNGKRNLFSENISKPKMSSLMTKARPRLLRRQASELVLTTAEKKSLDDLFEEYDSIASHNGPVKNRSKLSITDSKEKSRRANTESVEPYASNLSSSITSFDDLMDEYESIDQLHSGCDQEITWKRCNESKSKEKSEPARELGARSSPSKHRTIPTRTPMTPRHNSRISCDPYGLSCPQMNSFVLDLDVDLDDIT